MAPDAGFVNEPSGNRSMSDIGGTIEELQAEMARLRNQVQAYVQDKAYDLRHGAAEATTEVESLVRHHPLPAIGAAFAAGLALGLMIRGGRPERTKPPRLSRRDFERLATSVRGALEANSSRRRLPPAEAGDAAFLERLAGALSGLIQSSRDTAASVGSAGERAAKSMAAAGGRTARAVADRLSHVTAD